MATLIIKNNTAGALIIADAGTNVPASSQVAISDRKNILIMGQSDSLRAFINAGTVTLNDGITDLSIPDALSFLDNLWSSAGSQRFSPLPFGFIFGARLNWITVNQVSIGEASTMSVCVDSKGANPITWSGVLTADMAVAGPGGLQTGSVEAANTWYKVLAIADSSGVNPVRALLVPEGTAFNQAGYDLFRRVGYARNNGASQILKFNQAGRGNTRFILYDEEAAVLGLLVDGAATVPTVLALASLVPPIGRSQVYVGLGLRTTGGVATDQLLIRPNGSTTTTPLTRIAPGALVAQKQRQMGTIFTNGAQEIQYAVSNAADRADIGVAGYYDEI